MQSDIIPACSLAFRPRTILFRLLIAVVVSICAASPSRAQRNAAPASLPGAPSQTPPPPATRTLTREEAVRLALDQASAYQQAQLSEQVAAEDLRQAQAAFLPRVELPSSFIYTSPNTGSLRQGAPREPSFIAANAIREYESVLGVSGELDVAGRLRATMRRNRALLDAARAGADAARRALVEATEESYYALALAAARRRSAEQSLAAASEFERITSLLASGGEIAPVDLVRARLQTTARRDELEQARAAESAAADVLRVFVGIDTATSIATTDLSGVLPEAGEVERFTAEAISRRPELAGFEAEHRAAEHEAIAARAERLPKFSYFLGGGFDTDSFQSPNFQQHSGGTATVSVTIPIFDWGASKSRERQARLRAKSVESQRAVALRTFAQQFYTARAQALAARARIKLAAAAVTDAGRNVEVSIERYRAGEAAIIEVTDAQTTLALQRAALSQAIYDYQVALSRLRQATAQ